MLPHDVPSVILKKTQYLLERKGKNEGSKRGSVAPTSRAISYQFSQARQRSTGNAYCN